MTSLGARGQTLHEIHSTIAYGTPENQVHEQFQRVIQIITRNSENKQVNIANKLYAQNGFQILPSFLESSRRFYGSNLETLDFRKRIQSASLINKWVSKQTKEKIKEIIKPEHLNSFTRLVLINALYFKDEWDSDFRTYLTKPQKFYARPNKPIIIDFLHNPESRVLYGVHKTLHFEVLEKSFKYDAFRFGIILPNLTKTSLKEIEKKLSAGRLKTVKLSPTKVNITIPKFKIQSNFELIESLGKLGIRQVFMSDKSDLSGIESSKSLSVSKVLHKAIIEVDENGVVASAATAVNMGITSFYEPPSLVITFRADHPFIFYIKHVDTGSILFLGRFSRP